MNVKIKFLVLITALSLLTILSGLPFAGAVVCDDYDEFEIFNTSRYYYYTSTNACGAGNDCTPWADNGVLMVPGTTGWGQYMYTKQFYNRVTGLTFSTKINPGSYGGFVLLGLRDTSSSNVSSTFVHSILFAQGGAVYVCKKNNVCINYYPNWKENTWYDIKIILKDDGADYYFKESSSSDWLVYNEVDASAENELRIGIMASGSAKKWDEWSIGEDDCIMAPPCTDNDGDGYGAENTDLRGCSSSATEPDCNDANLNINPGMAEVPYNGLDDDCNSTTYDDDLDRDGYDAVITGGTDCNDSNPNINPGAVEICDNNIDDDCDDFIDNSDIDCDTIPPDVSVTADPSTVLTNWQSTPATADVSCTDELSGCDTGSYRIYETDTEIAGCPTTYSQYTVTDFPHPVAEHKWICAAAKDLAGLAGFSSPAEFLIDTTAPEGGSISYADGAATANTIAISVDAGYDPDPVSGIKERDLYIKEAVFSNSQCGSFPDEWTHEGAYDAGTTTINFDADTDTCYKFMYEVVNNADLSARYESANITQVDYDAPETSDNIENPDEWHSNNYRVELTCNDDGSGCADTYYCYYESGETQCTPDITGNSFNILISEGQKIFTIRYYSVDNFGNTEDIKETTLKIDNTVPSCVMTELSEYTNTDSFALEWSGSDPTGASITEYEIMYANDSEERYEIWNTFPGSQETATFKGEHGHKYYFKCKSKNDKDEWGHLSSHVDTTVDTEPPAAEIILEEWENRTDFMVEWTGTDSGPSGISHYILEYKTGTGNWQEWTITTPPVTSAVFTGAQERETYSFRIKANDSAGNMGGYSEEKNITIDLTAPECILNPMPEWINSDMNPFAVIWAGTDTGSGISSYDLNYSENGVIWTLLLNNVTDTSFIFDGTDNHEYYFTCRATDNAGNRGDWSDTEHVTVDVSAPAVSVNYDANVVYGNNQIINASVSDNSGIYSVNLSFDGSVVSPENETKTGTEWNMIWKIENLDNGSYSFNIEARDTAGNIINESYSFEVVFCIEGTTRPCGSNIGACEQGNQTCTNGAWGACQGNVGPAAEICNNIDDDCDGETDENLTQTCGSTSLGVCTYGTETCSAGQWTGCNATMPGTEICGDGLDNDCDGSVDEGCECIEGQTKTCGESSTPPCRMGTQTCTSGRWGQCVGAIYPEQEICGNGIDEDCNGIPDDGCGTDCYNGIQDGDEEGIDCGGSCPASCAAETEIPVVLIAAGIGIIILVVVITLYLKKRNKTWADLEKKWSRPSGFQ